MQEAGGVGKRFAIKSEEKGTTWNRRNRKNGRLQMMEGEIRARVLEN